MTYQAASLYVGVSVRTLENWTTAGHLRYANVCPMGERGRKLLDREHLDAFVESFVGAAPSKIVMNRGRVSKTGGAI